MEIITDPVFEDRYTIELDIIDMMAATEDQPDGRRVLHLRLTAPDLIRDTLIRAVREAILDSGASFLEITEERHV